MPSPSFALPALFLLFLFPFSSPHSFHNDGQSLLAFKRLITSDPNDSLADWSPTVPLCNWSAVTCGGRHPDRVVAIDLNGMDLRGTISPSLEYGLGERVSTKGDVYSYGIMLLEMLTRKRPTNNMFIGDLNLHKWVSLAFPNKVKEVIDSNLFSAQDGPGFEENNIHNCLLSLLRVGLLCSKDSPDERPTMRDVVIVLENLKENLVMEKTIASKRLRRSISNILGNTNTPKINVITSNDQSSSTF